MKTIFGIKNFELSEYAISGNALLGIRDSGKTWAGCEAAEELFDAGVPSICFDPIGKWHSLRVPGKGKGYPFVVAGGRYGDLPLNRKNAADLVRAAMKDGISLVLDLFSREMTKADWRYIVQQSMEILLYENEDYGTRHVFLEEAGEFVPQRVIDGATFNAVEKVVRMGGNSKLGCTMIHQRPADINKSVLELCANIILLKQSGKNTVTDLKKWAQIMAPAQAAKVGSTLPHLKPGHGWAFLAGIPAPFQFTVPQRNSKHPDRREAAKEGGAAREAVPATKFVEAMKAKLAEKAPAASPKAGPIAPNIGVAAPLQAKSLLPAQAMAVQRDLDAARATGKREGFAEGYVAGAKAQIKAFEQVALVKPPEIPKSAIETRSTEFPKTAAQVNQVPTNGVQSGRNGSQSVGGVPPKGELAIMIAAEQFQGVTAAQLGVLTGYKKSSRGEYIKRLKEKGFVQWHGDKLWLTGRGQEALPPDFERLPTGQALQAHWLHWLSEGERKILKILIAAYPNSVGKDDIEDGTGYKKSSVGEYLKRMKARLLWEKDGAQVRASDILFG